MGSGKRRTMREKFLLREPAGDATPTADHSNTKDNDNKEIMLKRKKGSKLGKNKSSKRESRREDIKEKVNQFKLRKIKSSTKTARNVPNSNNNNNNTNSDSNSISKKQKVIQNIIKRKILPDKETNRLQEVKEDLLRFDDTLQSLHVLSATNNNNNNNHHQNAAANVTQFYNSMANPSARQNFVFNAENINPFEVMSAHLSSTMERLQHQD